MTDEQFVKLVYPNAQCFSVTDTQWGSPIHYYQIHSGENYPNFKILSGGGSPGFLSEELAWHFSKFLIDQAMKIKLEQPL